MNPNIAAGVDYRIIDPIKLLAQKLAAETAGNIVWSGIAPNELCRGESTYYMRILRPGYMAHIEETLGTKEHLAGMFYILTGDPSGFYRIAQCTIAMIVNDMLTSGIPPISIQMHLAAGSSDWFKNVEVGRNIMEGWKYGCDLSRAIWTGGETPALNGTVVPGRAVLSGSAVGFLNDPLIPYFDRIKSGDRIIGITSSGVHANGISNIRKLVDNLGDCEEAIDLCHAALAPTHIYADLIHAMHQENLTPSYALNMTGHGFMKIMRSRRTFTYRIENILTPHRVFDLIENYGEVRRREMFKDYNMGTGFVFMADPLTAPQILQQGRNLGYNAIDMGEVEESHDGKKRVIIEPEDIVFEEAEMQLR